VKRKSDNPFGDEQQTMTGAVSRYSLLCGIMAVLFLTTVGCSDGGPKPVNPKQVYPVTGIIQVDGKPQRGIKVKLAPNPLPADRRVTLPIIGRTDDEGKFKLTTYYQDDGAPVGEYNMLFSLDLNPSGGGYDHFRGKYSNPQVESEYTLSVKGDKESIDVGLIELTSP